MKKNDKRYNKLSATAQQRSGSMQIFMASNDFTQDTEQSKLQLDIEKILALKIS